jgi:HD-GYP domain-containing protein (c-di-GMP phosphodiesterase class II)
MSQAILISDNQVINSLYEVNLRAYVGTNVTIKDSLKSAAKLLEQSPNIDAIICFNELNSKENVIDKFHEFLQANNLEIPVIVLGEPGITLANSIIIKNKYDIQSLLKSMAKILEVTAKDMAAKEVPNFFPIPVKLLSELKKSHCDIYFRNTKEEFDFEYFKIIEKESDIAGTLKNYLDEGIEHLFIEAEERLKFINKTSGLIVNELGRSDLSNEEKIEITSQGMGIVAEEIFENPEVSGAVAEISLACIESINQVVKEVPRTKNLLAMLVSNQSSYVYKHGILTTYISSEIIKHVSWGSKEQTEKVAFALFFHDIYLTPVYNKYPDAISEEDLLFRDDVSEEDKQTVLDHAKLAGQLVKTFPRCPLGADMIITQHHGMTSGQGFAVNFKDDISPLSKIIIVAEDIASGMLQDLKDGDKKAALNTESISNRLNERYKNHTYKKIIEAFKEISM